MRLENGFEVPASRERAWAVLNDVPAVVPCLPGAELTRVVDDNAWQALVHVRLGPIALQFLSDVSRVREDPAAGTVALAVKAREAKGRGGATATIESTLSQAPGGTHVSVVTDLALQGAVAQYGRGVVGSVAEELTRQFAECLARRLQADEGDTAAAEGRVAPVSGIRLTLRALWSALSRPFRRR